MSLLYTLKESGYLIEELNLPTSWEELVQNENWEELYQQAQKETQAGGFLFETLAPLLKELSAKDYSWELMLAKREGPQDEEEEGIWHDDASRVLAFSLSLNHHPQSIEGGHLMLRHKQDHETITSIETQNWGKMVIFPTGRFGWDHKISRVTSGNRLVLVGWISEAS